MRFSLETLGEAAADVRALIEAGLAKHALAAGVARREVLPIAIIARDHRSQVIGGLMGRTVWGWLHVSELWVEESHRHAGIGRKLMVAAEAAALQRRCHASYLDTFDFQAVAFYQALGYSMVGALEDFPLGHTRFFLQKRLELAVQTKRPEN